MRAAWHCLLYGTLEDVMDHSKPLLANSSTQCETYMLLAIAFFKHGQDVTACAYQQSAMKNDTQSKLRTSLGVLAYLIIESVNGIPMSDEKYDNMKMIARVLDGNRPEYRHIIHFYFQSIFKRGDFNFAHEIASRTPIHFIGFNEYTDAFLAVGKVAELKKSEFELIKVFSGEKEYGLLVISTGYSWMKLGNTLYATKFLEMGVRHQYRLFLQGNYPFPKRGYQLLQQCYATYFDEQPETEYRQCEKCNNIVARANFIPCNGCRRITYCSQTCLDEHLPDHREVCSRPRILAKRIDFFDHEKCEYCFCGQAKLTCSKCKKARYCDADCQVAHWKEHKVMCL